MFQSDTEKVTPPVCSLEPVGEPDLEAFESFKEKLVQVVDKSGDVLAIATKCLDSELLDQQQFEAIADSEENLRAQVLLEAVGTRRQSSDRFKERASKSVRSQAGHGV